MHILVFHKTGEVLCHIKKKSFLFSRLKQLIEVEHNFIILFTCCIDFNLEVMKINKILFDDRTIENGSKTM